LKELLDKISSYNLFNYLLPGVVFAVFAKLFTHYKIPIDNLVVGAFACYFAGLVISRFGSLIIEPFLKKISFLKFADYSDFVSASQKDSKIELFSEVNNMYRTLTSMFVLLMFLKLYEFLETKISGLSEWGPYIVILLLLIIFLFAYRKQTSYITKRIRANKSKKPTNE
jgi:hypothetical protein